MGKTSRPLYVVVGGEIADWDEWQVLREKNNTVVILGSPEVDWTKVDVVFSPRAWRMDSSLRVYLDMAITGARKARYPGPPRDKGTVIE